MSKKIVTIGSGSKMSMTKFINDYSPKYLKKLSKEEKSYIQSLGKNESYFLPMERSYLCKVTRTM